MTAAGGPISVTGCPEFDYASGQPNLYRMMRYKQALVRDHSLADALAIFVKTFGLPAATSLREMAIESDRHYASRAASVFVESGRAGEPFVNAPPRVIGVGNHRPIHGTTRSQFLACFEDAEIRGRSALVRIGDHLLLDVQDDEARRLDDEYEWDPMVFRAAGDRVWTLEHTDRADPIVADEAFSLVGAHTDFFGHWMAEYLPRYVSARLADLPASVPVLIDAHMPPAHRESIALLYPGVEILEVPAFRVVRAAKLWCAPSPSYFPLHEIRNERFTWDAISVSGERLTPLIGEMQRRFDAARRSSAVQSPAVFLARRDYRHRRLVNSEAIERIARRHGCAVVYPEDLSFEQQVSVVRDARLVVAPEGSALFLTMFARQGTTVCIVSHPLTDLLADYNAMLAPHGIDLVALTGPIVHERPSSPNDGDYRIEESAFTAILESFVSPT